MVRSEPHILDFFLICHHCALKNLELVPSGPMLAIIFRAHFGHHPMYAVPWLLRYMRWYTLQHVKCTLMKGLSGLSDDSVPL